MDCAVLLISVLFGFGLSSCSHAILPEYHYVSLKMNWTDAQHYCRVKHTDLATIESIDDVSRLNRPSSDTSLLWIGLRDDTNSWRWSATGDTSKTGYYNWQPGLQSKNLRDFACVVINGEGTWKDSPCDLTLYFICYNATNPPGQKKFFLYQIGLAWKDAQAYCRTHHTDLAMIENAQENTQVFSVGLGFAGVWIGLYRTPWRWSDISSSPFTNWGIGQPNNIGGDLYCAAETSGHYWNVSRCDSELSFFCYGALKVKTTVVRIKIQTDADLSDPAINAQILQQLGAGLTDKSSLTDFNLRWKIQPKKQTERKTKTDEDNGKDVLCN
ncbi:C-type mannose receptor 2-like [Micropterus salmoides]|uniref:C-type mannose receptor 2-like n=1 Tax=Micropterus salmoides TaxID=27706 RepID=UPI0018ED657C|nr:C-type mannose receptor 2-like [Micropterus salmoides]